MERKKEIIFLIVIFCLALTLRSINSDWGIWEEYHVGNETYLTTTLVPDEGEVLSQVGWMLIKRNPLYLSNLGYGPIQAWITVFLSILYFLTVKLFQLPSVTEVMTIGRIISILAGSLSVVVIYFIGRKINKGTAIISSLIFAFIPLHVVRSKWMVPDPLNLLWILLAILFALKAYGSHKVRDYALIGLFLALSTATKYFGVLFLPLPLVVYLMSYKLKNIKQLFNKKLIYSYLTYVGMLLITLGITILYNFERFMEWVQTNAAYQNAGGYGNYPISWPSYLTSLFPNALTWGIYVCALVGIILIFCYKEKKGMVLFFSSLVPLFALLVRHVKTLRFTFILFPLFIISAGYFLNHLIKVKRSQFIGYVLIFLLLANLFLFSMSYNNFFDEDKEERLLAARWVNDNIPKGAEMGIKDLSNISSGLNIVNNVTGYKYVFYEDDPKYVVVSRHIMQVMEKYFQLRSEGYQYTKDDWYPLEMPDQKTIMFFENLLNKKSYRLMKGFRREGKFLFYDTKKFSHEFKIGYGGGIYIFKKKDNQHPFLTSNQNPYNFLPFFSSYNSDI